MEWRYLEHDVVQRLAHHLWEGAGRPLDQGDKFYHDAMAQMNTRYRWWDGYDGRHQVARITHQGDDRFGVIAPLVITTVATWEAAVRLAEEAAHRQKLP